MSEIRITKADGKYQISKIYYDNGNLWDYVPVVLTEFDSIGDIRLFSSGLQRALKTAILREKDFEVKQ